MSGRSKGGARDGLHLGVRVDPALHARLTALVPALSRPGLTLTFSDVARMALTEGASVLERTVKPEKGGA